MCVSPFISTPHRARSPHNVRPLPGGMVDALLAELRHLAAELGLRPRVERLARETCDIQCCIGTAQALHNVRRLGALAAQVAAWRAL